MNYNDHSKLEGKHAFLSASQNSWLNKDEDQILNSYARQYVKEIGTALHDIARKHVKHRIKMTKAAKREVMLSLVEDYHIPEIAIERGIDFDGVFENVVVYVNDSINHRMMPEQILYYSDLCFGTADAISNLDSVLIKKELKIFDLKTGTTPVHIEQLLIYAALFCLEYNVRPGDLDIELRIYQTQKDEVVCMHPTAEDIAPIMDKIVSINKNINNMLKEK